MKPGHIPSLHDRFFKQSMSQPAIARDFFRHHLPSWVQAIITLDQLQLQPGSFVNPKFQAYYTDLLYQVPMQGKLGYLFLLAEHKSFPSKLLPLQLWEYMIAIWRRHVDQHPNTDHLPLIFPLCFYHGRTSPYPYSTDLMDCFEAPRLAQQMCQRPIKLIDVTQMPNDQLAEHDQAALFQLAQKYIFQNDLLPILKQLAQSGLLEKFDRSARDHLMSVIKYWLQCGESQACQPILETLTEALPNERGEIMTIAQQLEEKGRQEGKAEGRQEGVIEGFQQCSDAIARNALKQGADIEFVAKITDLPLKTIQAMKAELDQT